MPARLEIALKENLVDAEGEGICHKANQYFGLELNRVRSIHVVTIDADLTADQLQTIQREIFTNPVTQVSAYTPLDLATRAGHPEVVDLLRRVASTQRSPTSQPVGPGQ